jgi:DNA-binding MarR family transcriptional regulator
MIEASDDITRTTYGEQTSCRPSNPAVAVFLGMARWIQQTERLVAVRLQCHRLNAGQLDVLVNLSAAEGLTQQELAGRLCHSKANISQLLDKMETSGLVRREPNGRAYEVYLTDVGRAALETALPESEHLIAKQFDTLEPAEQAELFRLVGKLDPGPN